VTDPSPPRNPIRATSDTHGFTEHLFGLCALLGIAFMPRLKDLPDQVLSRIDRDADYGALQPLLRARINVELILEQWDQLVRLAASLKDRLTPAHVVMQRLANANASDRLAGALTQLGRLMKTIHILRYIHEAPLRDARAFARWQELPIPKLLNPVVPERPPFVA